jgi:hypothetical protein
MALIERRAGDCIDVLAGALAHLGAIALIGVVGARSATATRLTDAAALAGHSGRAAQI